MLLRFKVLLFGSSLLLCRRLCLCGHVMLLSCLPLRSWNAAVCCVESRVSIRTQKRSDWPPNAAVLSAECGMLLKHPHAPSVPCDAACYAESGESCSTKMQLPP